MFRVLVRFWVGLILLPQLFPVDVRATLRPSHPRLLITNDQSAAAVAQAKADPLRADSA